MRKINADLFIFSTLIHAPFAESFRTTRLETRPRGTFEYLSFGRNDYKIGMLFGNLDLKTLATLVYRDFLIRPWQPGDRDAVCSLIGEVLLEFGLAWQPDGADADVVAVEAYYLDRGGEFWVVEQQDILVGTAAYYPIKRGENAVEIRKMYLHSQARGQGLGQFLLQQLEARICERHFDLIWIETASVMGQAVRLYEKNGYQPTTGVETQRCDRVYYKLCHPRPGRTQQLPS